MKTQLTLVAASLIALSGQAQAFDFGVNAANADQVNTSKWSCKKCTRVVGASGSVGVAMGTVDTDDDHAANALGHKDGFAAEIGADYLATTESGIRHSLLAEELGSERGDALLSVSKAGAWAVEALYDKKYHVDTTGAQSDLRVDNGQVITLPELVDQDLDIEREKLGFNAEYLIGQFGTFVQVSHETREGKKVNSLSDGLISAQNIANPVDGETLNLRAGVNMTGQNWFSELGYQASWYDNQAEALEQSGAAYPVKAGPVDNTAYAVFGNGQIRFGRNQLAGRVAVGEMEQDSDVVTLTGLPGSVNDVDVSVDTTDFNLRLNSQVISAVNLTASVDYSDRDNQSDLYEIEQVTIDGTTGEIKTTEALDVTRATYKFGGSYRIAAGHKVRAGVKYENIERSESEREETDEIELWASYRLSAFALWDLRLKGAYSERDGSDFEANAATSSEDNELLRRYNLADRNRSEVVLDVSHTPLDNLSMDLRGYYALDDYEGVGVGLVESKDYGWDFNVAYQPISTLNLSVYGGLQWIDNEQLGSDNNEFANWSAKSDDEFSFAGVAADYTGFAEQGVLLGVAYNYANSNSDSFSTGNGQLGDYESTSHSVAFNASYALTEAATLGLRYQYEGYEDSDYADIPAVNYPGDGVTGLQTLGYLAQDYNAHLIMATFSYDL